MRAALIALLPACLLAQQPHPDAAANWFPLAKGAHWQFRVEQATSTGMQQLARSYDDEGEVDLPDGNRGHQLRRTTGDEVAFEYWAARPDGVFAWFARFTMDRPPERGVEDMPPARWLRAPLGIETRWQFDQPFVGQIASRPGADPAEEHPWPHVHHDATLVSPSEKLTVPAGTFDTAHVRVEWSLVGTDDPEPSKGTREFWFARGIGFVKQLERDRNGTVVSTTELVKFTPGTPEPDPQPALQRWLSATAPWSQRPDSKIEPKSLGDASCLLFGRCYAVRWQQELAFLHVRDGVVTPIRATAAADWQALLQAHSLRADDEPILGAIAEAAVRLECIRRGLPAPALSHPGFQTSTGATSTRTAMVEGEVRDGTGVRGRAHGAAVCDLGGNGTLTKVTAGVREPTKQ